MESCQEDELIWKVWIEDWSKIRPAAEKSTMSTLDIQGGRGAGVLFPHQNLPNSNAFIPMHYPRKSESIQSGQSNQWSWSHKKYGNNTEKTKL